MRFSNRLHKLPKSLWVLLWLLAIGTLKAQSPWVFRWAKPQVATAVFTDRLGDIYAVQGDLITKYKEDGKLYRIFSNKQLGRITRMDAGNPLKIIVFYRDLSRVVFLDNTLSETGEAIRLETMEADQTAMVCWSYDNGIWLFDPVQFTLIRYNQRLQRSNEIRNLNQILGFPVQAAWMTESGNHVYVSDPSRGILQFDLFGTYLKTIPLTGVQKFQVLDDKIVFRNLQGKLVVYSMRSFQSDAWDLPEGCSDFSMEKDQLYLLHNDSLKAYQWKIP